MVRPLWKLISVFLALGVFLLAGTINLVSGEDLVWVVGKAVGSFIVCWIVLSQLGAILFAVVGRHGQQLGSGASTDAVESVNERG